MQRIYHFLIFCFTTAIFSTFAQDSVAPLATDFRVDESGAAVLSIPIDLPIARDESQRLARLLVSSYLVLLVKPEPFTPQAVLRLAACCRQPSKALPGIGKWMPWALCT